MRIRRSEGFTLIELMIVVAIIGILAAIAIPNFLKFQCKSKQSEAKTNLSGVFTAEKAFFGEYNTYGTDLLSVNWQPDGAPVYIYGISAQYPSGSASGAVPGIQNYQPANNNTLVGSVMTGGGGSTNRYNTAKMKDLTGAQLAAGDLGSAATACDGNSFIAGAAGDIDTDAGKSLDVWSINHQKQLTNVQNDCST